MERFYYKARAMGGGWARGRLGARDVQAARDQLMLQGCWDIELRPVRSVWSRGFKLPTLRRLRISFKRGVALPHQLSCVQRLAALLDSGLPLLQALELLQRQAPSARLKDKLGQLKAHIRDGHPFSMALSQVQPFLDALAIHMVRAAEAQGALPEALNALVVLWRKRLAYRRQLQSLLLYPAIVALMGFCVLGFLALWVLPRFEAVFTSSLSGFELPWLTRCVLSLPGHSWALVSLFLSIGGLVGLCVWAPRHWGLLERVLLCLPKGKISLQDHVMARLGSSLGALLAAGVPILQSLSLSAELLPPYRYKAALAQVRQHIQNGKPLSASLKATQCFPEALIHITEVGEASGRLPELLQALAQDASGALHARLTRALGLLEPAVLLCVAALIGTLALALFLPITHMLQNSMAL